MLPATKFTANTVLILATDLVIKIANYGLLLFVARSLSIAEFGFYNFIVAYFYIFWVISDFGLQYLATRQFAENQSDFQRTFSTRFYMAIVAFILSIATLLLISMPFSAKLLIILYSCAIFFLAITEAIFPVFRGTENFIYERTVSLIKNMVFVIGAFIVVYQTASLYMIAMVYLLSEIVGAVLSIYFLNKYFSDIKKGLLGAVINIKNFSFKLLRQSFPLALGIALLISYYKIDGIMLKLLHGDYALGIYSSAYRIFEATLFIPIAIHTALIPRLMKVEKDNLSEAIEKVVKITISVGLIISLVVVYLSGYIPALYGKQGYEDLIKPLTIIFLITPIAFMNYIFISVAYVLKKEKKIILPLCLTIALNIGLNYYFIPKYSYIAAAWTTGVSELLLFALVSFLVVPEYVNKFTILKFYAVYMTALIPYFLFQLPLMVIPALAFIIFIFYIFRFYAKEDLSIFGAIYYELAGIKKI